VETFEYSMAAPAQAAIAAGEHREVAGLAVAGWTSPETGLTIVGPGAGSELECGSYALTRTKTKRQAELAAASATSARR
jgi:hypothetical protein